jgi:hypothetical protein
MIKVSIEENLIKKVIHISNMCEGDIGIIVKGDFVGNIIMCIGGEFRNIVNLKDGRDKCEHPTLWKNGWEKQNCQVQLFKPGDIISLEVE